jgi:hypothetical protein
VRQLLDSPGQLAALSSAAAEDLKLEVRSLASKLDQHMAATRAANPLYQLVPYVMQGMEEGLAQVPADAWVPQAGSEDLAAHSPQEEGILEQLQLAFEELNRLQPSREEINRHKQQAAQAGRMLQENAKLHQWERLLDNCSSINDAASTGMTDTRWSELEALCTVLSPTELAVQLKQQDEGQQQQQQEQPRAAKSTHAQPVRRQLPTGFVQAVVTGYATRRAECLQLTADSARLCHDLKQPPQFGIPAGTLAQQFSAIDVLFSRQAALEGALSSGLAGTAAVLAPVMFEALDAVAAVDPGNTSLLLAVSRISSAATAGMVGSNDVCGHQGGVAGFSCHPASLQEGSNALAMPVFATDTWLPAWRQGMRQLVRKSSPLAHSLAAAATLAAACGAAALGAIANRKQLLEVACVEPVPQEQASRILELRQKQQTRKTDLAATQR